MEMQGSLLDRFRKHIRDYQLFNKEDKLLIAVSGGVDSVVLCELCRQAGYDFSMAHCNFQLRGEESDRDEEFVKKLAGKYQFELFIKKFDTETYSLKNRISIQEAARNLRYDWFNEFLKKKMIRSTQIKPVSFTETGPLPVYDYLLTAHHADDNIETLLMNFFRGTGLHGMTGISAKTGPIRRPLLPFSKNELIVFGKELQLEFVEDSSNASSKYTRNFIRNELVPSMEKIYPELKQNLQHNINRFVQIEKLYKLGIDDIRKKLCKQKGKEIHIPVKQLMNYQNTALIYEIIKDYGFSEKQVEEVIKLAGSESGKYIISPGHTFHIIRHRHWLIITPANTEISTNIIINQEEHEIQFPLGKLWIKTTSNIQPLGRSPESFGTTSNFTAALNSKHIVFPLLLRKWKTADYFYPLGMRKKKKLSRFLIDQKMSKTEKDNTWVIESNKRIIWVVGQRIDDRFKLLPETKESLQIEFLPAK